MAERRYGSAAVLLSVDIYVGSNRCMSISAEFRPFHFRCIQFDFGLVPNQITKCLRTISLILVKYTHFRVCGEVECKAGQFGSRETTLAIVYKLPEDGVQKRDRCRGGRAWAVCRTCEWLSSLEFSRIRMLCASVDGAVSGK